MRKAQPRASVLSRWCRRHRQHRLVRDTGTRDGVSGWSTIQSTSNPSTVEEPEILGTTRTYVRGTTVPAWSGPKNAGPLSGSAGFSVSGSSIPMTHQPLAAGAEEADHGEATHRACAPSSGR